MISKLKKHWLGCALGAVLATALGLVFFSLTFGDGLIRRSFDLPLTWRHISKPENVVIIYLDEISHKELDQPLNKPWNRALHARLIRQLKQNGAKAVVFDIIFDEPGVDEKADDALAQAIKEHGTVVLSGERLIENVNGIRSETVFKPLQKFRDAGATWGITQLPVDPDAVIRRHLESPDDFPSLALAAAKALQVEIKPSEKWINYYGPPGSIPYVSYSSALQNELTPGLLRDKIVFVGARQSTDFSGKGKDEFGTAFTWISRAEGKQFAPGVEIHATILLNLLRRDWLVRFPRTLELLIVALTGILAGAGLPLLRPARAVAAALFLAILLIAVFWILFRYQLAWCGWLILLLQIAFAFAYSILFNSIQAYVEKQVLERSLSIHISPRRVKQLVRHPELLRPGAEKQELSIMFSDIADFSTISDRMIPDKLFHQLNKYFGQTIGCIHQAEGTVVKLIGDAIFAIWNAPEPQPNHQELACRAALLLRDKLVEFDAANESFPMKTRVGLHAGPACVGNCGSTDRFDYTAIGANINLASRLEGLNKHVGTDILASDDIIAAVENKFVSRSVGHFRMKGSDRVMEIFELIGSPDFAESTRPWRESFADGLRQFKRGEFDAAQAAFDRTLQLRPKDGPSHFYLKQIAHYRETPPEKGWFGEVNMTEK